MLTYVFSFASDLLLDMFNTTILEIIPQTFLCVIGFALFQMLRKVA